MEDSVDDRITPFGVWIRCGKFNHSLPGYPRAERHQRRDGHGEEVRVGRDDLELALKELFLFLQPSKLSTIILLHSLLTTVSLK